MRALGALVRVVGIASFATFGWGCQVLGGVDGDLVLSVAGAGGPVGVEGEPLTWEASDPGPGEKPVYELPDWLYLYNKTEGLTSQHESTLKVGYGPDEARPRNVGKKWGIAVERDRTNLLLYSDWYNDGSWLPGQSVPPMSVTLSQEDLADDGLEQGVRFDSIGQQQSNWTTIADQTGLVASTWVRGVTGSSPYAYFAFGDDWQKVDSGKWMRAEVRSEGGAGRTLRFETQAFKPGVEPITTSTAVIAYGAQVEAGKYPSSFIPTAGGSVFRDADRLLVVGDRVAKDGWFSVTIRFAPHYATDEQEVAHDILTLYRSDIFVRLQIDTNTQLGSLVLKVPGGETGEVQNLRINGLKWTRNDPLTVVAWSAPDGRFLSIEGATQGNGQVSSGVPAKPLVNAESGEVSVLLGDKNGAQESADLQYVQFR